MSAVFFDGLDVSYGEAWGSHQGTTHPEPLSRAVAARRHAAGMDYAVLLSARERPLALVERWPRRMWRVYLFDDRSRRMQMIDLRPHSTGMLLAHRNTRWQVADERGRSYGTWDVRETTTVSADGQVEVRSESAGPGGTSAEPPHARTSGPSDAPARRFPAPVENFLSPVPEFGDWQVFAPFLAQQGHEPATAVVLRDVPMGEESGPLRASGIEQLFRPGACGTPDGPAVVEPVEAGLLRITSGRLAVSDPGLIGESARTVAVPPGEFPVTLSLLRTAAGAEVAAARVTFLDAPPREWDMALLPDEDLGLLGGGQFYGVGVDTGTVAFVDATRTVIEDRLDEDLFIPLDSRFTVELPGTETEPNLIAFRAGRGDGSYPVWIGRTDDGQVVCVVVDFQLRASDGGE
ncbi:DUF4241 domain-containing protein [Streptomyces sp. NBC_00102]|uniref:DUF4241 domain-containing protein n=1 Tax=Streptomyces sp. NBC_00102 TaxID=2975652 RepID=UPI00224F965F|nr:DUF4241 domain-containing protein [Streptomyces sp. NBC_00102]MCX5400808.1 DUF4241 domain-containing protein [Streptomyces sp. NBC_00102]